MHMFVSFVKTKFREDNYKTLMNAGFVLGAKIAETVKSIVPKEQAEGEPIMSEEAFMKQALLMATVIKEVNRLLFYESLDGSLLMGFLLKDGHKLILQITRRLIELYIREKNNPRLKRIVFSQHFHFVWNHLVEFYICLFGCKYLDNNHKRLLNNISKYWKQITNTTLPQKQLFRYFMAQKLKDIFDFFINDLSNLEGIKQEYGNSFDFLHKHCSQAFDVLYTITMVSS